MKSTTENTISLANIQYHEKLCQHLRTQGYLFLDTEDGEVWVWNNSTANTNKILQPLTYPQLGQVIKSRQLTGVLTTVALLVGQQVRAVAVLRAVTSTSCEILSLRVHPHYRQQGNGRFLLNQIELLCLKNKVTTMTLHYRTYWKDTAAWEHTLNKLDWTEQRTLMHYIINSDWEKTFQATWYQKVKIPAELKIVGATSQRLHQMVQQLEATDLLKTISAAVHPLQLLDQLDEQASIIAYQDNQLVGWCLVHRLTKEIWQCTTLYLFPEYRAGQLSKVLTGEMGHRHAARGNLHFMIDPRSKEMFQLAKKHYEPTGAKFHRLVQMQKSLSLTTTAHLAPAPDI